MELCKYVATCHTPLHSVISKNCNHICRQLKQYGLMGTDYLNKKSGTQLTLNIASSQYQLTVLILQCARCKYCNASQCELHLCMMHRIEIIRYVAMHHQDFQACVAIFCHYTKSKQWTSHAGIVYSIAFKLEISYIKFMSLYSTNYSLVASQ